MQNPLPFLAIVIALLVAGCSSPSALQDADTPRDALASDAIAMSAPVELTGSGRGYEPSIRVGADGTIYVTAHKASLTHEGTRLASWLWHSRDGGRTWQEMPSPAQYHDKLFAFEGDLAIDAEGRVYYVDTYLVDNTISRWNPSDEGPRWDFTRPVHGTAGVDDRPWLAAHGDGIVYYLGNNGAAVVAPSAIVDGDTSAPAARIWFYASDDGGHTWSLGHGFPGASWCGLEASPADDQTVWVGCTMRGGAVHVYESRDRGTTWTQHEVGKCARACGWNFPSIGVDAEGRPYMTWISGAALDDHSGSISVARLVDERTWEVMDVTPFEGSYAMIWASGGRDGALAVTFYGTVDAEVTDESEWHAYLLLAQDATAGGVAWSLAQVDAEPVSRGRSVPGDFFQNAFGPHNEVHVAYQRVKMGGLLEGGWDTRILHAKQVAGVNLLPQTTSETSETA